MPTRADSGLHWNSHDPWGEKSNSGMLSFVFRTGTFLESRESTVDILLRHEFNPLSGVFFGLEAPTGALTVGTDFSFGMVVLKDFKEPDVQLGLLLPGFVVPRLVLDTSDFSSVRLGAAFLLGGVKLTLHDIMKIELRVEPVGVEVAPSHNMVMGTFAMGLNAGVIY